MTANHGRRVPRTITLAPQTRLAVVAGLAPRFFREVVGYEQEDCLVTDESDLRDFADAFGDRAEEVARMLDRLETHYHVDGRTVGSTRIATLLEFLWASGVTE